MNAIPYVVGPGPAGVLVPSRYTDVANTSVPSIIPFAFGLLTWGRRGDPGPIAGKRSSTMVGRWALDARPAQGRVEGKPRHVSLLLEPHPLFLVESPFRPLSVPLRPWLTREPGAGNARSERTLSSQRQAWTSVGSSRQGLRETEPASPIRYLHEVRGERRSRGKGVLAA